MSVPTNIVAGQLVIKTLLDTLCVADLKEYTQLLPDILGVEIPAEQLTNVIVSNVQPSDSQTTSIWFRLSNSGSFMGIYVFSQGAWHPIYPIADEKHIQVQWFTIPVGATTFEAPDGWTKIDNTVTTIASDVRTALMAQYVQDGSGNDIYFAAYFTGF